MQFPYSYFEDEVRDGFYVPGMMKHAWAAQLEVLEDISKVCERYHITYFADCGTLLGAVRHGGFIPWDDDMDICMKRQDYQKFLAVAQEALPEGYSILSIQNDENYAQLFARVVNSRMIRLDQPFLDKFHEFPFVCGIDIFPMDFLPTDEEETFILRRLLQLILKSAKIMKNKNISKDEVEKQLCKIEEMCNVRIDRTRSPQNELYLLAEKLCMLYGEQGAKEITLMPVWIDNPDYKTSKDYYKECVGLPFENTEIPVPVAYDAILRYRYGDYMKPVHNSDFHNYPFYSKQEAKLRERRSDFLPQKYSFSMGELHREEREIRKDEKKRARKEAVFLPYKASMWGSLESVWRAAEADPDCDTYVIPIPYYEKNIDGSLGEMHYEGGGYPDYVPIMRYNAFDFNDHWPSMIFIQNPYDEYNCAVSVDPFFYSANLKKYTDKLIYIPYFMTDEISSEDQRAIANMECYVTVPGVVHADKVIVQSENIRQLYIDKLAEFAGENTRQIWEEKIWGMGSPEEDRRDITQKDKISVPEQWKERARKGNGSYKKVIMYYTALNGFVRNRELAIEKVRSAFSAFNTKKEEILVLWRSDPLIEAVLEKTAPKDYRMYCLLEKEYCENVLWLHDEELDDEMMASFCDAYYGDTSAIIQKFKNKGKAVLIQNPEPVNVP